MSEKNREFYINSIAEGNIIAFRSEEKMYAGKVLSVDGEELTVRTKNGSIYFVEKNAVAWIKNGSFWPQGIHNALKLTKGER